MFTTLMANTARFGALCASIAVFTFSVNDVVIKFLSGDYALHEIVLFRALFGIALTAVLIAPFAGGWRIIKTQRVGLHILRGMMVVTANMMFFLGLAVLPLAETVAIFFVSPLLITVFSVIFLGDRVGPFRWAAVLVGLIGVGIVLRPGSDSFQIAALLPVIAATAYAGLHMMTRYIGKTESAATMTIYIQLTFVGVCIVFGLLFGDGKLADQDNASLAFLFRAWSVPSWTDLGLMAVIGIGTGLGGYFISQAYRVAEPSVVAPFEYLALPLSILWGYLVFDEIPDGVAIAGIVLILASGLFIIWRENRAKDEVMVDAPRARR